MDFMKYLQKAQELLDAIRLLSSIVQANTETTAKNNALLSQTNYAGNGTKSPDSETKVV